MWHKADWMGHPMRLELTLAGLLVNLANHHTIRDAQALSFIQLNETRLQKKNRNQIK